MSGGRCKTSHFLRFCVASVALCDILASDKASKAILRGKLCYPYITTTNLSYSVLSLKLPPAPCAALLIYIYIYQATLGHPKLIF